MKKIKIEFTETVIPTKGSNAGREMCVINDEYWSRTAPKPGQIFMFLKDVEVDGVTYENIAGFGAENLTYEEKIKIVAKVDPELMKALL